MKILLIASLFLLSSKTEAFLLFRSYPLPNKDTFLSERLNLSKEQQIKIKDIQKKYNVNDLGLSSNNSEYFQEIKNQLNQEQYIKFIKLTKIQKPKKFFNFND